MYVEKSDVKGAFLSADMSFTDTDTRSFMYNPKGWPPVPSGMCWEIVGNMYGKKDAPRCWWKGWRYNLMEAGFKQSDKDATMFTRWKDKVGETLPWKTADQSFINYDGSGKHGEVSLDIVVAHVDDGIVASDSQEQLEVLKAEIKKMPFNTKFEPLNSFCGLRIVRNEEKQTFAVSQNQYVEKILREFELREKKELRRADVPQPGHKLGPRELSTAPKHKNKHDGRVLAGSLLWAKKTRIDLAFGAHVAAQFSLNPNPEQQRAVRQNYSYLKQNPKGELTVGGPFDADGTLLLQSYSDSDFATSTYKRKSITGELHLVNGHPVRWGATSQTVQAGSSTEAELIAARKVASFTVGFRHLLMELGCPQPGASPLYIDNDAALKYVNDPTRYGTIKHLDVAIRMLQHWAERGDIRGVTIASAENPADLFTKALGKELFEKHRDACMTVTRE
jgi:hypothetical protein